MRRHLSDLLRFYFTRTREDSAGFPFLYLACFCRVSFSSDQHLFRRRKTGFNQVGSRVTVFHAGANAGGDSQHHCQTQTSLEIW